jgi:predicted CoA-substrate-specific enzyme activase
MQKMYTAGIDVGLRTIKIVILQDGKIVAKGADFSGGRTRSKNVEDLWKKTLASADMQPDEISKIVSTGAGKKDVVFADKDVMEEIADARAARFLFPESGAVVDIGADQTRVVTLGAGNTILETVRNQKCMAGLGLLAEYTAKRLDMTLDDMSASGPAASSIEVNDGCPVFAEMDALELLNRGVPKKEVASAVTETIIVRLTSVLNDKIVPAKDTTVLIGGMTKNKAVADGLKARSGIDFLIPADAEYAGALGAALIATEQPIPD